MGKEEIGQFLSHLAVDGHVAASTQNQTLNALVFLYKQVLEMDVVLISTFVIGTVFLAIHFWSQVPPPK